MTDSADDAATLAAQGYEDQFVPALTGTWAPLVVDAAVIGEGDRVLDVGCGTGVLARTAQARVGAAGSVTGIDPARAMLAVASRLAPMITWHEGSADSLPYPNRSFDAVVSQFGLMFVPDQVAGLREMYRVLGPGGRLAVAVWGALRDAPAYAAEVAIIQKLAGIDAAAPLIAPFNLGEGDKLARLARDAGIAGADVRMKRQTARFPSVRALLEADVRGWMPMMGITLGESTIAKILSEGEQVIGPLVTREADAVSFDMPALILTARRAA